MNNRTHADQKLSAALGALRDNAEDVAFDSADEAKVYEATIRAHGFNVHREGRWLINDNSFAVEV